MKSIKEKAKEVQIGYDDIQAPAVGRGFILGANYVLEEIEKVVQGDLNSHSAFKLKTIKQIVEQLKKLGYEKDYPISTYSLNNWV